MRQLTWLRLAAGALGTWARRPRPRRRRTSGRRRLDPPGATGL